MMNKIVIILLASICIIPSIRAQQTIRVESPDKSIVVSIKLDKGRIMYAISQNGKSIIEESAMGIDMRNENFYSNMQLIKQGDVTRISRKYHTLNAKKSTIHYKARERKISFKNNNEKQMEIIFRVSNDGVVFRYYFPWIKGVKQIITRELSSFVFEKKTRGWLQPMSEAKTGWEKCHPSYEENYLQDIPVGTVAPFRSGWVYPALFKTTDAWVLLTEAGLDSNYCGTRLINDSAGNSYKIGFPDPREVFTDGGLLPSNNKPWYTPWRIITIGSLKIITESTLGNDLAPDAVVIDTSFIKPGKASWSWINSKDDSIVYEEQLRYINYAADMKWQYCLIDVNWDTKIGYERIRELTDYAKTKNVGIILWYNSAGDWNTVKFHPKGLLLTKEGRAKEFERIQAMGIKGVKIDFFGGDGQSMIKYYIDILQDAATYKLLVNFHGATLPRGWHITYPHLMTAEAVYGMEMVTFNQKAADNQPTHCTLLPFTRNVFDPMDFTPMNLYKLTHTSSVRKTTSAFELALSVLFLSGIQHFAESPEGMSHVPALAKKFLQTLPDNWDDVKFIDGYPGKYIIIARRSGDKWYVAGINGEHTEKTLSLDLSAINKTRGILINEGNDGEMFRQQDITLDAKKKLAISIRANGGFVIVLD